MGQITIYLDKETEEKMRAYVQSLAVSQSKWIAGLIRERLQTQWPEAVAALAGAWEEFPSLAEIRAEMGEDSARDPL